MKLAIASGKGGTGKTSLTASFAGLAEDPVVADCDVDAADLHLILAPKVKCDLNREKVKELSMKPEDCKDKVRLSVSDETGVMRIKYFDISNAPECREFAEALRRHLMGKPLEDIDAKKIRQMSCEGNGICGRAVADVVEEYQSMLTREAITL